MPQQSLADFGSSYLAVKRRMSWEGLEPARPIELSQFVDSTIRQKRQNRYFNRTEVRSGYTGYEFVSCRCPEEAYEM